jgi:transposase
METVVERPGALDVHKAQVTACVRAPADGGAREQHVAEFPTTVAGLLTLRDWLAAHGVSQITMEATGVFWKPVWAILEDEFELLLVNARHVKQVPGRKTDVKDAEWLCQLAEAGLLKASFVPPKPIRSLRNLTRHRKTQIQERAREANRLHKALEDTGIKLDCVASDILGVSGRAMLDALVAGATDPEVLAELAKGRLRAKLPALREALQGRFDQLHAVWIGAILAHLDFLDEQIASLTETIGQQIAPFEKAVELLCTIPGVQRRTAEVIIAEIGVDMSVFPSAKELASWAGMCPGNDQSAGRRRSGRERRSELAPPRRPQLAPPPSDLQPTVRCSWSSSGRRRKEWDHEWRRSSRSGGIAIERACRSGRWQSVTVFTVGPCAKRWQRRCRRSSASRSVDPRRSWVHTGS